MTIKPGRPCRQPRCPNVTSDKSGYCDQHRQQADAYRGNSNERGYDYQWTKTRKIKLNRDPLCEDCLEEIPQRITPATEVHHIIKLADGGTNDLDNLRSLCDPHHNARTRKGE